MDIRDSLKSMLNNIINDKPEQASLDLHGYLTTKMRQVSGLGGAPVAAPVPADESVEEEVEEITEAAIDVDDVLAKIKTALGEKGVSASAAAVRAVFVGGDAAGARALVDKMEAKLDFDSSSAWPENKKFYTSLGVSKAEYNALVKASL